MCDIMYTHPHIHTHTDTHKTLEGNIPKPKNRSSNFQNCYDILMLLFILKTEGEIHFYWVKYILCSRMTKSPPCFYRILLAGGG